VEAKLDDVAEDVFPDVTLKSFFTMDEIRIEMPVLVLFRGKEAEMEFYEGPQEIDEVFTWLWNRIFFGVYKDVTFRSDEL
jgi:hypothetical protein